MPQRPATWVRPHVRQRFLNFTAEGTEDRRGRGEMQLFYSAFSAALRALCGKILVLQELPNRRLTPLTALPKLRHSHKATGEENAAEDADFSGFPCRRAAERLHRHRSQIP